MKVARSEARAVAQRFGLGKAQRLHVTDVERDADGTLHLRYSRTLGGLPVMGGDFVVHQAASGKLQGADFATQQPLTLNTRLKTAVSASRAATLAARSSGTSPSRVAVPRKVVWAVTGVPRLAWLTTVRARDRQGFPAPTKVVIDARTGHQIQRWDVNETAKGTGHTLYLGTVPLTTSRVKGHFVMKDPLRGNSTTVDVHNKFDPNGRFLAGTIFSDPDNVWGNGKPGNRQSAATDVNFGTAKTWDFYKSTFHRNGIADNGRGAKSRVHYGDHYENAFWNDGCFCMTYGDGAGTFKPLVSLDVAGHEMSHGVTSRTAGLYYFGDAGGLNESTSDIFGSMVEFFAKDRQDPGDYYIGETIIKPGQGRFLRRMDNPQLDGVSYNCWSLGMGLSNPHYTSGPGNHFYYMLAEGSGPKKIGGLQHNAPTCGNAADVQGVGRAKAEQIWYRALTRYFVSTTGYVDARDDTIHAAIDLYGANSTECKQVIKAWNAVAVPKQYWTCAGKLKEGKNTFGPSPGFEPPNGTWNATGVAAITKSRIRFPQTGELFGPRSGKWYAFMLGQGKAGNATVSKRVTIPRSPTAKLRFYMWLSIVANPDGSGRLGSGTVDVKINGHRVAHFDQGDANNTYLRWDVAVDRYAGQTVTLSVVGHENASNGYFEAFLDDFTLTPR